MSSACARVFKRISNRNKQNTERMHCVEISLHSISISISVDRAHLHAFFLLKKIYFIAIFFVPFLAFASKNCEPVIANLVIQTNHAEWVIFWFNFFSCLKTNELGVCRNAIFSRFWIEFNKLFCLWTNFIFRQQIAWNNFVIRLHHEI